MYTIRLENTITHQIYEQQVQDNNNGEKLYFRFGVSTFDLVDGEYILTLLNAEGDVLAEDLMRIGDYNPEALQYSKGENTYIDVTLNAVLQAEKYVTITEIQTRIVPDLGNDAIETVYVDAQPLYDSARSEGYDEGYSVGQSEGYPNGFADGYDSGRTDGYNEGYDVGSMDMHLEMLEETRILNVTENGRYFTKYTEDPYTPTGDGDFSDFCKLTNATYQMGRLKSYYEVQETGDDVIEFWWKPKDLAFNHRPQLLMSSVDDASIGLSHSFAINLLTYDREDKLRFDSNAGGGTFVEFIISNPEMWYHILLENNGVYVNDEYVGELFTINDNETSYVYVNGDTRNDVEDGIDECNGYFGMVKINGEVFIPTENGYMDQNTGNIIQPIEGGEYEYLKQSAPEGGLYRTVNVNIDTKQFFLNGYDEGYDKGYNEGEQVSYDKGYEQGQTDTAANARVLNVTENGTYVSKFSEIPKPDVVTGVYPDGTEFYNFAELKDIVYNTGIKVSENTKVELWYKPRDLGFISYGGIIGTIEDNTSYAFGLYARTNKGFIGKIGEREYSYNPNDLNKWFHIELSFAEGFVIDGVNYGTYSKNTQYFERYLFINDYDLSANGYYGMIKIDDTIIIPTEEGFLNTNTGTLLEVVQKGSHSFTQNTPKVPEGELYKTVNVNVITKVNVQKAGLRFGNSIFIEVPDWVDFDGITDSSYMFYNCSNLKSIEWFNTELVTKANSMFANCGQLKTLPNNFNFSICTDMEYFFTNSNSINDYSFLETWVINPTANMGQMIDNRNTTYVPAIPCVGDASYYQSAIFWSYSDYSQLTYFGGWIGRKYSVTKDQCLKKMPNLTRESCISILNNLYDFVGNGETPSSSMGQLKVHPNFLTTVGDDIAIGTSKGWTITA